MAKKRWYRGRVDQGFFVMGTHFSGAGEGTCFLPSGGVHPPLQPPPPAHVWMQGTVYFFLSFPWEGDIWANSGVDNWAKQPLRIFGRIF